MLAVLLLMAAVPDEYEFVPNLASNLSSRYCKDFGSSTFVGSLDHFGNFVPYHRMSPITKGGKQSVFGAGPHLMFESMHKNGTNEVYEFRSNRLILGGIDIRTAQFIPAVGSSIIDLSEYKYSLEARPIYNLPGKFVRKKNAVKNAEGPPKLPSESKTTSTTEKRPIEPKTSSTDQQYDFKLDLSVEYTRQFGDWLYFGTLDEYGEFVFSGTKMPINATYAMPKEPEKYVPLMSHVKQKEVYEFRSSHLIPGTMEKGEFVPELGSKIIHFDDYKYSKDARPIYNLPGSFVPKEKGK